MNKSKILNIIIIIAALALIAIIAINKKGAPADEADVVNTDDSSMSDSDDVSPSAPVVVPTPATTDWTSQNIAGEISFDVPNDYYVSYPVIGGCDKVASISTQVAGSPTVPVALVYKDGCVTNAGVTSGFSKRQVVNGYVFQTSSGSPSVIAIFDQIVASAK